MPKEEFEAAIAKNGGGKEDPDQYLLKREFSIMETVVKYLAIIPLSIDRNHISNFFY